MSKEYTREEVEAKLINHLLNICDYWENLEVVPETRDKMRGLLFSVLSTLDGCGELPSFIIAPCPHPEDKEYHIENGENYFSENHNSNIKCDIGGSLHEVFNHYKKIHDGKNKRIDKIDKVLENE
jgi:hypothetical protein